MSAIEVYFSAERTAGMVFIIVGLLAIGGAIWGWSQGPFWRGAVWPFVILALIQIGVGLSVWLSSPKDIERVHHIAAHEPARIQGEEVPRMKAVMKGFTTNRWIELAVLVTGLLLLGLATRGSTLQGVGAGLAWQTGLIVLLDSIAERRAHIYLKWLQSL